MAINKTGSPNKIRTVATSEEEFETLKKKIVETNKLARWVKCGKLLAKHVRVALGNLKR